MKIPERVQFKSLCLTAMKVWVWFTALPNTLSKIQSFGDSQCHSKMCDVQHTATKQTLQQSLCEYHRKKCSEHNLGWVPCVLTIMFVISLSLQKQRKEKNKYNS